MVFSTSNNNTFSHVATKDLPNPKENCGMCTEPLKSADCVSHTASQKAKHIFHAACIAKYCNTPVKHESVQSRLDKACPLCCCVDTGYGAPASKKVTLPQALFNKYRTGTIPNPESSTEEEFDIEALRSLQKEKVGTLFSPKPTPENVTTPEKKPEAKPDTASTEKKERASKEMTPPPSPSPKTTTPTPPSKEFIEEKEDFPPFCSGPPVSGSLNDAVEEILKNWNQKQMDHLAKLLPQREEKLDASLCKEVFKQNSSCITAFRLGRWAQLGFCEILGGIFRALRNKLC